ncbi:complex 1 LYR-like protein (macronuclear) [Tetrahymena thermophila SB210]|uniref:Complex 1 LYR-like protein n=1 Tax=Tetrahymena thermophila (strain SB210) TaxID=312017 RepID=Q24D54_TETTS|nr:complex 1 LYR-like protein [Tetrahymena thermophila SB210]EAS05687.1 complex 1 LYR-like protein [Tetrahymena thermophila SB210]|eukprot:XP_001025932.1 complex 1 LYR-like protein [Tetrahymena thermophila SB210]
MSKQVQVVQKFYQILSASLPKSINNLYVEDFETVKPYNFEKINDKFLHDYELYLKTLKKQDEFLHIYRIGIKRDEKEQIESIAHKVGLQLPRLNTLKKN